MSVKSVVFAGVLLSAIHAPKTYAEDVNPESHQHVIIDFGRFGHTIKSLADNIELTMSYRLIGQDLEIYDRRYRASGFGNDQNYDCEFWSGEAMKLVNTRNAKAWEKDYVPRICSRFAYEALEMSRDDDYVEWEFKWATKINSSYAVEAFKKIRDLAYKEWEMQHAATVNTPYALAAFSEAVAASHDDNYAEWELRWAANANTPHALAAVRKMRAHRPTAEWKVKIASSIMTPNALAALSHVVAGAGANLEEWQLRWMPFFNADCEVDGLKALEKYDETELYRLARLEGLIGEFYEHFD